jgi:DNA modification methylase
VSAYLFSILAFFIDSGYYPSMPQITAQLSLFPEHPLATSPKKMAPISHEIELEDKTLYKHFSDIIELNNDLTRQIVSFQANKDLSGYRLFKYKEAFSFSLVRYFLKKYLPKKGTVLDPFCGSGTTVFASSSAGHDSIGIELLPIGIAICKARQALQTINNKELDDIYKLVSVNPWKNELYTPINSLRITAGAYPDQTEQELSKFLCWCHKQQKNVRELLIFSALAVAEDISYTRKDGQYLRWDSRASRKNGHSDFNKGKIFSFSEAITKKLKDIIFDAQHLEHFTTQGNQKFIQNTSLTGMQDILNDSIDMILTSPPYCNRYDYTRTYALELAILGCNEIDLIELRQSMISCTVENKLKNLLDINRNWKTPITTCDNCKLLQEILSFLYNKKDNNELNNNGIPRMIQGYFYDLACIIFEAFRTLRKGGTMIMVNDNVRYAGINISVDLILSYLAKKIGFNIKNIFVLPQNKGNSSQQMGIHGRQPLRKCVYVWEK